MSSSQVFFFIFIIGTTHVLSALRPLHYPSFSANHNRPGYIECANSEECGFGNCCVLGMGKFSLPRCIPHNELGQICRPSDFGPSNTSVTYPDGITVQLTNIHYQKCPCAFGLYCSSVTSKCEDPVEFLNSNRLVDY